MQQALHSFILAQPFGTYLRSQEQVWDDPLKAASLACWLQAQGQGLPQGSSQSQTSPASNGSTTRVSSTDPSSNTSDSWLLSDRVVPPSTDALEMIPASQKLDAITSLRTELKDLQIKRKLDMVSLKPMPEATSASKSHNSAWLLTED